MDDTVLEGMARTLEKSGRYRILRRLELATTTKPPHAASRTAVIVDTETTGVRTTGPQPDEVISLAMLKVHYDEDDRLVGTGLSFSKLRQPARIGSIPPDATAIHGITDEMVAGRTIDPDEIRTFLDGADDGKRATILVGHHVAFDAALLVAEWPAIFKGRPYACSQSQIDWSKAGFSEGTKLGYLLAQAKLFAGFHDALEDCRAVAALLALPTPSGRTAMQVLLAEARREMIRIYATGAPYACKGALRDNGYRWSSGEDGRERAWYKDVEDGPPLDAERAYLSEMLGIAQTPTCLRITAWNRFVS